MKLMLLSVFCVLALLIGAQQAGAMPHIFPDPGLPPVHPDDPDIAYYGRDVSVIYPQDVILTELKHYGFTNIQRDRDGDDEIETFDSLADVTADIPSMGILGLMVTLTGPVQTRVYDYLGTTGTFDTEIVSMSLSGNVGPINVTVRESPILASLGETEIVDLGGGLYHIDSFFDVFTELSVDGGPFLATTVGACHMELCPEPATISLLGLGAFGLLRRKRKV